MGDRTRSGTRYRADKVVSFADKVTVITIPRHTPDSLIVLRDYWVGNGGGDTAHRTHSSALSSGDKAAT